MTLDTRMYVHDEVSPHALFHELRRLLGATDAHPIEDRDVSHYYGAGTWEVGHPIGIGLPALCGIYYRQDGPYVSADAASGCSEDCDPGDGYHYHKPAMWCEVSMDTAYGYRDAQGRNCGGLHASFVAALGEWLDARGVRWSWVNEYNGKVFTGDERYSSLLALIGDSDKAVAWFSDVVAPAIFGGRS
jgi:hypothetical protein